MLLTSPTAQPRPLSFAVDGRAWPLLRITFHGPLNDAQFRAYLREYERYLARGERFVVLIDATQADRPDIGQRKLQAAWMRKHYRTLRNLNMGTGFVMPKLLIRMALRSILLLQRSPSPYSVFDRVDDAETWCHAQLEAARHRPSW